MNNPLVVEAPVGRKARLAGSRLQHLNARERDVLALMAQGRTNHAIAAELALTGKQCRPPSCSP